MGDISEIFLFIDPALPWIRKRNAKMAAWCESQLRKYDFLTDQLPRLSCKENRMYGLLKAGVSSL